MKKNFLIFLAMVGLFLLINYVSAGITAVNLESPPANNWTTGTNNTIQFQFNFTSNATATANATLWVNLSTAFVKFGVYTNAPNGSANVTIYANNTITEGNITWLVEVSDNENTTNSSVRHLMVDRTSPTVTINSPSTGDTNTSSTVSVSVTETDNLDPDTTCSITLESNSNTSITATNNTVFYSTWTLDDGGYSVYATCEDSAGNSKTSSTAYFNVNTRPSGGKGTGICTLTDWNPYSGQCCPLDKPIFGKGDYTCIPKVTQLPTSSLPTKPAGFISVPGILQLETKLPGNIGELIFLVVAIAGFIFLSRRGVFNE